MDWIQKIEDFIRNNEEEWTYRDYCKYFMGHNLWMHSVFTEYSKYFKQFIESKREDKDLIDIELLSDDELLEILKGEIVDKGLREGLSDREIGKRLGKAIDEFYEERREMVGY